MKTIDERTDHELAYTDAMHFVEALLTSESVTESGRIFDEGNATFTGKINLNRMTSDVGRYISVKVTAALNNAKLPSKLQPKDDCTLNLFHSGEIKGCKIRAVRFSDSGKVRYDVAVQVTPAAPTDTNDPGRWTVIKNVDSVFVGRATE